MVTENEIPKIDLPEDIITGKLQNAEILSLYTNFPCRIKAEIFVFCRKGNIEASINLENYHIGDNQIATVLPGNILKIHKIEGEVELYFVGFSSQFVRSVSPVKSVLDIIHAIRRMPVLQLKDDVADAIYENMTSLIRTREQFQITNKNFNRQLLLLIVYGLGVAYEKEKPKTEQLTPGERISQEFSQLVIDHYVEERNVSFYAQKLGITPAYLSTVIKQMTGKTCTDIIGDMVIMDAKAQLKSTALPIQEIAYSLHFPNVSFFGKYFKRHVGVGPLEYRNEGNEE